MSFTHFLYKQLFVTPDYPTRPYTDQTVIVTGANVGLGLEAARHIARLNAAKVILAVRNTAAGEEAKQSIEASTGRSVCEVWHVDLSSYTSVVDFAQRASKLPRLDAVIANAAVAPATFKKAEGHEQTITVNVISTLLMGLLLLPTLRDTAIKYNTQPHLTFVVSGIHQSAKFAELKSPNTLAAFDNPTSFESMDRYATSKLVQILVIRELVDRLSDSRVVVNMLNPGLCHSQLARDAGWGLWFMKLLLARSTEVGSRTLVLSANLGPDSHGAYTDDGKVDNEELSEFVRSEAGRDAQKKMWREISAVLEEFQPGVTNV
ncbi:hypothetical protein ASPWEDRAFT_105343 [Aspergillus wentii DTO 134E9]|uniref:Ketoreductase (KR) domain-containing protein n=1 Tax=Aspergillus wentii DTO 134E9 TaxID=1073089 RepID=A0A1L9RYN4_ASPWE|nr:uncharacterized protein ASPWEDRAFT_105343 [Aspergillus wentii DTO 134E9]KAI9931404.1 hypothetical protein MW887_009979 [Aspergillus wentii]OJJ39928.1 hypothetical protein ASPWEDRAFT_105343 [Aspergillus wentii DTO 134E9]